MYTVIHTHPNALEKSCLEFLKLTFLVRKQAGKNRIKATAAEDLKMAGRAKVE